MTIEQLIYKANRITELRRQVQCLHDELRSLESEVATAVRGVCTDGGRTIEDLVAQLLEASLARVWSAEEVATQLDVHLPSVRAALSKLVRSGRVRRSARNRYEVAVIRHSDASAIVSLVNAVAQKEMGSEAR